MATISVAVNTELLEELGTKVLHLMDGLVSGEFDPDEIRARSTAITESAEDWQTHINAELDR